MPKNFRGLKKTKQKITIICIDVSYKFVQYGDMEV